MQKKIEKDSKEVYAVIKKLSDLMIARDTTSMNKILDKNFYLTPITRYKQPRSEWLHEIMKEIMRYYSTKEVNHDIKVSANKADVTIQSLIDARIWGTRNIWRLQQNMKLENSNGNWIILSSVASLFKYPFM